MEFDAQRIHDGSSLRRSPRTVGHGGGDLPRADVLGRRGGHTDQAIVALAAFAVVGSVLGTIAQSTVDESVRQKIELELAARAAATSS